MESGNIWTWLKIVKGWFLQRTVYHLLNIEVYMEKLRGIWAASGKKES